MGARYTIPTAAGPAVPLLFAPDESLVAWRDNILAADERGFTLLKSEREILPALNAEIACRVWTDGQARYWRDGNDPA